MSLVGWTVKELSKKDCQLWIENKHYSKRMSIYWKGFGLISPEGKIEGCVVYGQPSPPIQKHAFKDRDFKLYELGRLVVQTEIKNAASFLISNSLKQLESHCAIVSYADEANGHCGIVYQATNWLYTGSTVSHDHLYLVDGKKVHPMTLRDQGITNPKQWAKENNIQTVKPERKHRYFYLRGNKKQLIKMKKSLAYESIVGYPKRKKTMYENGPRLEILYKESK
jgi:hypothetical protein